MNVVGVQLNDYQAARLNEVLRRKAEGLSSVDALDAVEVDLGLPTGFREWFLRGPNFVDEFGKRIGP